VQRFMPYYRSNSLHEHEDKTEAELGNRMAKAAINWQKQIELQNTASV